MSAVKHSKTSPEIAKNRLSDETSRQKPNAPRMIEIRKTALRPNLSESTLMIKYRNPPKNMVMKIITFFNEARSQYKANLLTKEYLSLVMVYPNLFEQASEDEQLWYS